MKLAHFMVLMAIGLAWGCNTTGDDTPDTSQSVISGVVSYSPGIDGELWPRSEKRDTGLLPEAYIALINAPLVDLQTQEIVASDTTDSAGIYQIIVPPGEYLLVVSAQTIDALVIATRLADSTLLPTPYNAIHEVDLKPGDHLEYNIHLSGISVQ